MGILAIIGVVLLLAIVWLPMSLVQRTIRIHGVDRPDLPGTGGELARHLLDGARLQAVKVEPTDEGRDHYDPEAKAVRLSPSILDGRSVSAVAIAAHEVSHALQDAQGHRALALRVRWARTLDAVDKIAFAILISAPIVLAFLRAPVILFIEIAAAMALLSARIVLHLVTLPSEIDASFNKALPILERGGYLQAPDLPAARSVLRAAAFTYVAAALMTLIDIGRWLRILRF